MSPKSIILIVSICAAAYMSSIEACLFSRLSSWWNTTEYNGSRTLINEKFINLKMNGAATLNNVEVSESMKINGAATLCHVEVAEAVVITGSTTWNGGKAGDNVRISGNLILNDVVIKGALRVKGSVEFTNSACNTVIATKITAYSSKLGTITLQGDKNRTVRFHESEVGNISVEGLGDRIVILNNSSIDTIAFENKGGVVKLLNDSLVKNVINGTIEENE